MFDSTEGPDGASFNAVKRCCKAWNRALDDAKTKNLSGYDAMAAAKKAYRRAMPYLCGEDNIRGFIACIAEAVLIGAIYDREATKLVYLAQVALTGLPRQSRPAGRPPKNPEPPAAEPETPNDPETPASNPDSDQKTPSDPDTSVSIQACSIEQYPMRASTRKSRLST